MALATRDVEIRDAVLSAAAAVDVEMAVIETMGAQTPCPSLALVGPDLAAEVARAPQWESTQLVLVGFDAGELARWSMSMDARVIVLPDGNRWLGALLAGEGPGQDGLVVALVGGSGGLGTSTLALGVGAAASARGVPTAVVDGDPRGGGLDLLCGIERAPGWRWPQLCNARGETAAVGEQLPTVDGLSVLSMGRLAATPGPEARAAVLGSLRRSHRLIVVDAGRGHELDRDLDSTLLVVGRRVHCVASAREVAQGLAPAGVVVRDGRGSVSADEVAQALGLPLWSVVPDDSELARGAEVGTPPGLAGRRRFQRACAQIVDRLLGEAS